VVNRGFIGFDQEGALVAPPAPAGAVTVEGIVQPSQERGRFGPTDPGDGDLPVLARVDLDRLEAQLDYDVLPAYVQLVESDPAQPAPAEGAPLLVPLGRPELDDGPHLSYAAQWFIFTLIAAGGYVVLLRRMARDERRAMAADAAEAELDRELAALIESER
jgi:cytochrome oxidase assembly protein ShyY1